MVVPREAMKVVPETYDIYKQFVFESILPLPLLSPDRINNCFIVRDVRLHTNPEWFEERDFRKFYKFTTRPNLLSPWTLVKLVTIV